MRKRTAALEAIKGACSFSSAHHWLHAFFGLLWRHFLFDGAREVAVRRGSFCPLVLKSATCRHLPGEEDRRGARLIVLACALELRMPIQFIANSIFSIEATYELQIPRETT